MASGYGVLTLGDADKLVNVAGQSLVWDTAQAYFDQYNQDMADASRTLVERVTTQSQEKYFLPGGGMMQRRGGQAQSHAVRPLGSWTVAVPLEEFGDQIAGTKNGMAKMTLGKMQNTIRNITIRSNNTRLFEMARSLFLNTTRSFPDDDLGTLTIQPLATATDGVMYPPLMGTTTDTTLDSYYGSNYLPAAISDANNPIEFIADNLRARFGDSGQIVVCIHLDQRARVEDLADFEAVADPNLRVGISNTVAIGAPADIPGRVIGYCNGAWVTVWPTCPTGYVFGFDGNQPRPLLERKHETGAEIPQGLHLVTESFDASNYPFIQAHYEDHFGYGVGNRINGVILQLAASLTYTAPVIYT